MRDAARQGLAVGFFDGVHLGHREILRGASAALTFRNHPLTVLAPARAPRLIMTLGQRLDAIRACGVGDVTALDFTPGLAAMPPEAFAETHLAKFGFVRCGADWRFGRDGRGDAALLASMGIAVEVVPCAEYRGERISSSRIRACLGRGEIEDANAMMGRRYEVRGEREAGKGLGTKLGYPTINLRLSTSDPQSSLIDLPHGVYEVLMEGRRGIANYGLAPTMGDAAWREPVLEVHLFTPQPSTFKPQPQPSPRLAVQFVRFLRPERKFDSIDGLKRQIAEDCAIIGT